MKSAIQIQVGVWGFHYIHDNATKSSWSHCVGETISSKSKGNNLNNITFSAEELQCSIFTCIPGAGPVDASPLSKRANEVKIPKHRGLDLPNAGRTPTPTLLCIDCPGADPRVCTQPSCWCSATVPPFFSSQPSSVVIGSPLTSPLTPHRQLKTGSTQLIDWLNLSPSNWDYVSAVFFFPTSSFLLVVHPKIAPPL